MSHYTHLLYMYTFGVRMHGLCVNHLHLSHIFDIRHTTQYFTHKVLHTPTDLPKKKKVNKRSQI